MEILKSPAGGTPPVINDDAAFADAIEQLRKGNGAIAIDAERASGFRYSARAYLIQVFRREGGLHLIDPIPLRHSPLISELDSILQGEEVVIHASTQDLPCLRDFGLHPKRLFDTELGARLAGLERVGLASLCENLLGISLAKEHSAVDWSIRPLRSEWLDYAALDVDVLLDLRDSIEVILRESKKLELAQEEFQSIIAAPPPKPRHDPWRRTSGMHLIKSRYELAIIQKLWEERDRTAAELDIAPGRLFSDAIIVEVAHRKPSTRDEFLALPSVIQRIKKDLLRERIDFWWEQIEMSYQIPESHWPQMRARGEGLPPPRIWKAKFPIANIHLLHAKKALTSIAIEHSIPVENLVTPEFVRTLAYDEGRERTYNYDEALLSRVTKDLERLGARRWQRELTAEAIARALTESSPPAVEEQVPSEE